MQHTLAMSSTEHNLWTIANILGLVVVVAVAALLTVLVEDMARSCIAILPAWRGRAAARR